MEAHYLRRLRAYHQGRIGARQRDSFHGGYAIWAVRRLTAGRSFSSVAAVRPRRNRSVDHVYLRRFGPSAYSYQARRSATTNLYAGNTVKTTDPAGKWKQYTNDAFGNLTAVVEPDPNSSGTLPTYYTYNAANQLTAVSMTRAGVTQNRSFTWSGSDLASSTNPENGTVTYTYDANHHVTKRTDALGHSTQYSYDGYERLTNVTHSGDNRTVTYTYDSPTVYSSYEAVADDAIRQVELALRIDANLPEAPERWAVLCKARARWIEPFASTSKRYGCVPISAAPIWTWEALLPENLSGAAEHFRRAASGPDPAIRQRAPEALKRIGKQ